MNLWPVEHFFPHLFFKISADQRFIRTEVTSYKIHILVYLVLKVLAWEICNIELEFAQKVIIQSKTTITFYVWFELLWNRH